MPTHSKVRLLHLETCASEAGTDKDLAVGAALLCIKTERLFLLEGFASFWEYVEGKRSVFGVGRRHAERLMRGHAVLHLLRCHPVRPTTERQVLAVNF